MDVLYFQPYLYGIQFLFQLYLLDRGQPHFLGHVLGGQLAPLPDKTVVVGLAVETYPVHIKMHMGMCLVPVDKGDGLIVPSAAFPL